MESSFFEYRNDTVVYSGSEEEVIDNSLIDDSFAQKKKNRTVFVAESEESTTDDDTENEETIPKNTTKSVVKHSQVAKGHNIMSSSDDDSNPRGSIRRQSDSSNKVVLSSSEDDQASPEMVPKRRPPLRKSSKDSNNSFIGRKTKKRIMQLDSDTENSIIIEHDKHKKLLCMKNTPLKITNGKNIVNDSIVYSNDNSMIENDDKTKTSDEDDDMTRCDETNDEANETHTNSNLNTSEHNTKDIGERLSRDTSNDHDNSKINVIKNKKDCLTDSKKLSKGKTNEDHSYGKTKVNQNKTKDVSKSDDESDTDEVVESGDEVESDDDGPDEDQMAMSRATRMSIMGVIPDGSDSDESDFIQSDDSNRNSGASTPGLSEFPEGLPSKTPEKPQESEENLDNTKLTCSPFSSPLQDITNKSINIIKSNHSDDECTILSDTEENKPSYLKNKVQSFTKRENLIKYDDDVTIIDTKLEVIALSSDEEDEVKEPKKSPVRSPKPKNEERERPVSQNIKQYLAPPSYPSQQVVYVKKHQRDAELMKYEALKSDLKMVRDLLENMEADNLPDNGGKLIDRLSQLEEQFRRQGDKVASMIVEPEHPSAADIAKDGFNAKEGLSWDEIQKASNAVQPRMFGKQAMATHIAERHLIMDRLRDLYESLASRPSEATLATAPPGLRSTLLPHQLHALAWLRWRETQRPRAGILADDMGLGKTITMISLIVSDKQDKMDEDLDDDDEEYPTKPKLWRGGTLVVCPASLIQQWASEVTTHCKPYTLSVCLHHGAARAQQPARLAANDLVVTTYNIMQRDNEKNGVLMKIRWRRVILDEAHIVRNHKSATCGAVTSLAAARRWCLTGTPVQNKDLDLFALLKFLKCSPFDDLTMWKKWIDNKSLGGQERLSTIMQCLLLRRTKAQLQQKGHLACLPQKQIHQRHVTLSQPEMNVYQKVLVTSKTLFAQFLHQRAEKNNDAQGFAASRKDDQYAKMHKKMIALQGVKPVKSHEILVLLLRLRQVCCHCGLIAAMLDEDSSADVHEDPAGQDLLAELNKLSLEDSRAKRKSKHSDEEEEEGPAQEGGTAAEAIRSVLSSNNPVFQLDRLSSKIEAVMQCLRNDVFVNKDDKAVVVSQWTSVLRLVEQQLNKDRVKCVTLSGSVPVPARPALIQAINDPQSGVKVMLLSLCAGGVGLNLVGASHLLVLDPHWNPQLEAQAQDRVYRVGQKKDVNIYKFMCVDTVEQTIRKLQEAKLELAENVLTGAKNTNNSKLTIEDLKMLFNMGQ